MDAPKNYDPQKRENAWQEWWEKEKVYHFDPDGKGEIFSVDTPPPTVSGRMHIGHAFSYVQQDIAVRYKRMKGFNVFYPFGTDDNGLPTQMLIEKTKGVRACKMDRNEFAKLCLETLETELRPQFISDWKRIGMSCDFDVFYTTMDEHSQRISQQSFIDLYKAGREYRMNAPTIFCPKCQTAISQVEMEDQEFDSHFNDILFELEDGTKVTIATTRPELLPACVAMFVHPDDKRFKKLVGKTATVPLFGQKVKILTDTRVDMEKGSGIVMCCTFGDQTDIEWYKAFKLDLKIAITKDGKMTAIAQQFEGMKIKEARKAILEELKKAGVLTAQKKITHAVNVHERCGTEVEILESPQWFIKYLDMKDDLLKAGKQMNWFPAHMRNRYDNWVKGLQWDWCISRQIYFGIPFPVWYCKKCDEVKLANEDQLPVDPLVDKPESPCSCGNKEFIPEKDIINTWATSSLTPIIAADLFKDHKIRKKLFPMNLRPQAHDIISFWLFNTVVKSQMHHKKNPFKDIMISGWALDPKGRKMSKSKGNVIDPHEMIEKYSVDALRYWAAGSKLGEDLPFQEKDLVTGKKTSTKLWNAAKFSAQHLEDFKPGKKPALEMIDRFMLSKLNRLVKECTEALDQYEYSKTKLETDKFFWKMLCDNYIEISKDRLYNPEERGKDKRLSAQYTLHTLYLTVIKLFAPIMPYITEELYNSFFQEKVKSIHLSAWPTVDESMIDEKAEAAGEVLIEALQHARRAKTEKNLSLKAEITHMKIMAKISEKDFDLIKDDLIAAASIKKLNYKQLPKDSVADFEQSIEL